MANDKCDTIKDIDIDKIVTDDDIKDKKIDYAEISKNISLVQSGLMSGITDIVNEQYKLQRLKSHELAEILSQLIVSAQQSAQQTVLAMAKLDPSMNPFFKEDLALKRADIAIANSKIEEACNKAGLIEAQRVSYKIKDKIETTKVITSGWATATSQSKLSVTPIAFAEKTVNNVMEELLEYTGSDTKNKYSPKLEGKESDDTEYGDNDDVQAEGKIDDTDNG
jgi:hypothetical protein